jgi:hypothetical protein
MLGLEWDGDGRLGQIALGMSLDQVKALVPGYGEIDAEDDDDPPYYWNSDNLGLSIQFQDDVVIAITAKREFAFSGVNLVGMPAEQAISLAGSETGRDAGYPIDFVQTSSGLELYEEDGHVLMVVLST